MLILVSCPPPRDERLAALGTNVSYRPELARADPDGLARELRAIAPDAIVTAAPLAPAALAAWREARPGAALVAVDVTGLGEGAVETRDRHGITHARAEGVVAALQAAERTWNRAVATRVVPVGPAADRSVALVGGGVVNLVTALLLRRHGYAVTVYDKAPDPRADADPAVYGCTRGGGDGRMFTLTEADSYNSRARGPDGAPNDLLDRPISADGWLVAKPGDLLGVERRWADDFHRMPPWLADSYNEDIFAVNQAASPRWAELMVTDPALFGEDTGYRDGILRLYTEPDYFDWHLRRNERLGAVRRRLSPGQVGADYPALTEACANGTVAGGIEVTGFTVNIYRFLARLVDTLEASGVAFHWNQEITRLRWAAPGQVDAVETAGGRLDAAHVVLSPGAYGAELLRGTGAEGTIQGMLGVWLSVPNIEPRLDHSLKIARKGHRAEETNATLGTDPAGEPILICGSGYGWTGQDPVNVDLAELDALFDSLTDTLRRFFPRAYQAARAAGTLDASRRHCVRPWTPSCLGVFETLRTTGGGLVIVTGGHNTGGFAQSPVVAEAVLAALEGREHAMHTRYHPRRLERFYRLNPGPARPA